MIKWVRNTDFYVRCLLCLSLIIFAIVIVLQIIRLSNTLYIDDIENPKKIEVINMNNSKPLYKLYGYFSIKHNDNLLEITIKKGGNDYIKTYVSIGDNTFYTLTDISSEDDIHKYEYHEVIYTDD